jgi:hypothetical protein
MTATLAVPAPALEALRTTLLHAEHGTTLPASTRLLVGAFGGLAAALVATVAMSRLSYGSVPAYVAAGVLRRDPPNEVSRAAAHATHLAAGVVAGVGYEAANVAVARAREPMGAGGAVSVAGLVTVAEVLVGAALVAALYGVFSWLVFPRFGGNAYETRPATVRRQWAISAVVYAAGLVVFVGTLYEVLPL